MTGDAKKEETDRILNTELTVVYAQLYKNEIENSIPVHIPRDERHFMRWFMPDNQGGDQTSAFIDLIGEYAKMNYTTVQSTALLKGLSMFAHNFGNRVLILDQMRHAALHINNPDYYRKRRSYAIKIGNIPDNRRKVITDEITHGTITKYALLLNIPIQEFTTILILYALVHSEIIPGHLQQTYQKFIDEFETCMKGFFQFMGIEPEPDPDPDPEPE